MIKFYPKAALLSKQPELNRVEADCAVLIPIRKSAEWWALTQDERRMIFEERSHHNHIGMDYLSGYGLKSITTLLNKVELREDADFL
jgi:chlorite dismutase